MAKYGVGKLVEIIGLHVHADTFSEQQATQHLSLYLTNQVPDAKTDHCIVLCGTGLIQTISRDILSICSRTNQKRRNQRQSQSFHTVPPLIVITC